ncbi:MAG: PaaI family thioesterase [Chloroflexi bacterium]|nr:MAG: PaaI family thioesterase [Chloroflexota bacterium]RLC92911.1 MAG: PaaI family thioesterase [Chloroflexota bacterium]
MSIADNVNQKDLAEFKARVEKEPVSSFLGMELVELSPGYARVNMKMRPEYLTFNGYIYGGIVVCAADQAFACAVNSGGRTSIATQFNIHFIAGPGPDDVLTAECRVVRKGRRVDVAEMTVTNQDGKLIATATGTAIPIS